MDRARLMLQRLASAGFALVSTNIERGGWKFTWLHTGERPPGVDR